ncbi:MAG: hypothetical protein AB7G21_01960 [Dehalococcoidia bacterium]
MIPSSIVPSWPRAGLALLLGALLVLLVLLAPSPARAVAPHRLSVSFQPTGTSCTEALAKGPSNVATIAADRPTSIVVCAHVEDVATATDQSQVPVEMRVTVGALGSSGTSKYSGLVFSSAAGVSQISYRGDGASFGTDTVVATYAGGTAAASASIEVTPPTGRVPARIVVLDQAARAIAATTAAEGRAYVSPAPGASVALQVQDADGRGVDGHALLVTAAGGRLAANPAFAQSAAALCAAATARTLLLTSNPTDRLAPGGQARPGLADVVVCAADDAMPGEVVVTVESVTEPLPPATLTLARAGRPAAVAGRIEPHRVVARVTDAAGAPVADGTPVRFALAPAAGVVSAGCVLTRGGEADVAVGLDVPASTLLVTAEYATSGATPTCTAAGTERVHASIAITAVQLRPAASEPIVAEQTAAE